MLEINGLSKKYGDKSALDNVSFSVAAGERVALLGANGSGKTTTINSICRLLEWDSGSIHFDHCDIRARSNRDYLKHIGAVLGGCRNINWRLTATQNAQYFARLRGFKLKDINTTIDRLSQQLGLDQYRKHEVGKLSTGNKQKAALLSALAYQPKLLLLDEPTLGLDSQTVAELQNIIIAQSNELNQGFLITSHDMAFIDKICTRVVVLEQGNVIYSGDISALKKRLFHFEMQLILSAIEIEQLVTCFSQLWPQNINYSITAVSENCLENNKTHRQINIQYDTPDQAFNTINWLSSQQIKPLDLTIEPLSMASAYHSLLNQDCAK